jgi:hypothetical protein
MSGNGFIPGDSESSDPDLGSREEDHSLEVYPSRQTNLTRKVIFAIIAAVNFFYLVIDRAIDLCISLLS